MSRVSGITATMSVKWVPSEREFGKQIADLPQTKTMLGSLAEEVASEAQATMARQSPVPPKLKPKYPSVGGVRFSARPSAISKEIKVGGYRHGKLLRAKFKSAGGAHKITVTQVAIVVSDHPYSKMWERGTYGLPKTKYMSAARVKVRNKHAGVRLRAK